MFAGGRSFIHSIPVTGVKEAFESSSELRRSTSLEIRITGNLEVLVDCNRPEVAYSSSVSGIYAQPLWKNGFREESAETRSEKVQSLPMTEMKSEWNILIVIVSRSGEVILLLLLV